MELLSPPASALALLSRRPRWRQVQRHSHTCIIQTDSRHGSLAPSHCPLALSFVRPTSCLPSKYSRSRTQFSPPLHLRHPRATLQLRHLGPSACVPTPHLDRHGQDMGRRRGAHHLGGTGRWHVHLLLLLLLQWGGGQEATRGPASAAAERGARRRHERRLARVACTHGPLQACTRAHGKSRQRRGWRGSRPASQASWTNRQHGLSDYPSAHAHALQWYGRLPTAYLLTEVVERDAVPGVGVTHRLAAVPAVVPGAEEPERLGADGALAALLPRGGPHSAGRGRCQHQRLVAVTACRLRRAVPQVVQHHPLRRHVLAAERTAAVPAVTRVVPFS